MRPGYSADLHRPPTIWTVIVYIGCIINAPAAIGLTTLPTRISPPTICNCMYTGFIAIVPRLQDWLPCRPLDCLNCNCKYWPYVLKVYRLQDWLTYQSLELNNSDVVYTIFTIKCPRMSASDRCTVTSLGLTLWWMLVAGQLFHLKKEAGQFCWRFFLYCIVLTN